MFLAAVDYTLQVQMEAWDRRARTPAGELTAAEQVQAHEASQHGGLGLYRIVFTGLTETDDPDIRASLIAMYRQFHKRIRELIAGHRSERSESPGQETAQAAWAIIGLATVANIMRELELALASQRRKLLAEMDWRLLEGTAL